MTVPFPAGQYETAPLAVDRWTLGVVQSQIHPAADDADQEQNLEHMLHLIDNAHHYGAGPDLLLFHEFPISGWDTWTREEALRRCIEIPGPEFSAIAAKAKEYGTYIAFGAYVRDEDWPGHVLSLTTLVGPDGEVVASHWKARNVKGLFPGFELFTTTIYDVLDEYVERYGRDAVLPIARTPLGNITMSSTQHEPELMRALSIKGAEVVLRTASGSFMETDVAATAMYNRVYCAIANNALLLKRGPYFQDTGAGGSAIYGPDGRVIARADDKFETLVTAPIPIADFRARHLPPDVHWDLVSPVFDEYTSRFPPNLFTEYLPESLDDAAEYVPRKSRWRPSDS
ncbi:nitrilase-related carbon-nitrogen hydrolase [Ornithinimicrobium faecis]|uniref:nitrilase-related carbon-nitrogen hydrolase n=1 Tax=Ornithinimicrobium faecis TaxID=2934158 RepID=UPI002118C6B1|nr:nitrilase-related carbon-nitrogen hydrolase [Ornithinimicrobium sp. HY1745]